LKELNSKLKKPNKRIFTRRSEHGQNKMSAQAAPSQRNQIHFKCVVLGNSGVGKSCLTLRFVRDEFVDGQETTIGAAFLTKNVFLEDANVRIEIWDTAGQERYRSIAPMYYRQAQAGIIVYDITSRDSFDGAKSWVKELQRKGERDTVLALVGNKTDLKDKRKVDPDEASEFARENNMLFFEASAKDATNVERVFQEVAKKVPRQVQTKKADVVPLRGTNEPTPKTSNSSKCC
jgi:small GTP-binding protein